MPASNTTVRPRHTVSRATLLAGTSLLALILVSPHGAAARSLGSSAAFSAPNFASDAASGAAQQAAAIAKQSANALARATQAIQAMQAAQNAARAAAQASQQSTTLPQVTVPNGLTPGGLQVAPGATPGSALWQGANLPTQTSAGGQTNVGINQTAPQAILNWQTFNVGAQTTLNFNQQGNANWVALNRVTGSSAPSQILGNIRADGQIYVINQNGIIFGGASQINVGSLIASSANITDQQFLTSGIYSTQSGGVYNPSFTNAGGSIVVEAGAQIATDTPSSVTSGGGFVLLMGTQVQNAGVIFTPNGQTELAAGNNFLIRPGYGTTANQTSTTRGNEIAVQLNTLGSSTTGGSGLVSNSGYIEADTGDITLGGETVVQDGVLISTTSVNVRGTIHLLSSASDPFSSVTLTGNSFAAILPDGSGATALDSQRAALIADSATQNANRLNAFNQQFDDLSQLADLEDESRIEIVTGGNVEFRGNSLTLANGGQVSVSAPNRIQVDSGATIDVSGLVNVALPMSANAIAVSVQGNELRDDPNNRDTGTLFDSTIYVDARDLILVPAGTGGYATDRYYTAGGLLEVSGWLGTTPHTIGEWMAGGGTITLSTGATGAVVAQPGSIFNISGGSIQYQSGYLNQTYLISSDGRIFTANNAPADLTYRLYSGFTVDHAHWGVIDIYASPLRPQQIFQQGYTVGRDAGSLILSTPTSLFEGTVEAAVFDGAEQINARPANVSDPYLLTQTTTPMAGSVDLGQYNALGLVSAYQTDVQIADGVTPVAGAVGLTTAIPDARANTAWFDAGQISSFGLGGLSIATAGSIAIKSPLTLSPGGKLSLIAPNIDIAANLTVRSGAVSISNLFQLPGFSGPPTVFVDASGMAQTTLEAGATIDTQGLWTNGLINRDDQSGLAFLNGGNVTIDMTQGITLASDSAINTSSGAAVLPTGKTQGGAGGNIILIADDPAAGGASTAPLVLDGTVAAYGVTKGGALTLAAPSVLIGDNVTATAPGQLVLGSAFFSHGFSSYDISGNQGLAVADGTQVSVIEPVYQFTNASYNAPTGSDPGAALSLRTPPLYLANPFTATLTPRAGASLSLNGAPSGLGFGGGPVTIGAGARLAVDPGQSITITGNQQITVDGTLRAPGGTISITGNEGGGNTPPGQSIWIGGDAVLDVSARAATALDLHGQPYGIVPDGGSIVLGEAGDVLGANGIIGSTFDFIVIRPGAVLDASGTSALINPGAGFNPTSFGSGNPSPLVLVASNGGSITLSSYNGIYADGTMRATAGGPGAAGGTLNVTLETPASFVQYDPADPSFVPRIISISQDPLAPQLPTTLQPGIDDPSLQFGQAHFSAAMLAGGGFDNLSFTARDAILFDGNVNLIAGQSIAFHEGAIADNSASATVAITAPYVLFDGFTGINTSVISIYPTLWDGGNWSPSTQQSTGTLTVNASLIDVSNQVVFGIDSQASTNPVGTPITYDYAGFANVDLISQGDIRFLPLSAQSTQRGTSLSTSGNLTFTAAQLYPVISGSTTNPGSSNIALAATQASITAGAEAGGNVDPDSLISINRISSADPAMPYSIGGQLSFTAGTINQGGVIRAPEGDITLNGLTSVNLLDGSITSASMNGLTMLVGGTIDGITWSYNGAALTSSVAPIAQSANNVSLNAPSFTVAKGAVIDVSGGGDIAGAGFITGEGGSVNVLTTPLVNANPANSFSSAGDKVYAIVPGYQGGYAPVDPAAGAAPGIGQQITIPSGVPGLPAGTYTLLPANYALLPGGYRVELGKTSPSFLQGVAAMNDGAYLIDGYQGIANTGVRSALQTQLIVMSGSAVRDNSDFNEMDYSNFQIQLAKSVENIRPALPMDGGTLTFNFNGASQSPLTFDGTALFRPGTDAQSGVTGQPGQAILSSGDVEIYAGAPTPGFSGLSLNVQDLNNIAAPSLTIGQNGNVTIDSGVDLRAAQVLLVAAGNDAITVQSGAEIDTIGMGAAPVALSGNNVVTAVSNAILVVSNADLTLNYITSPSSGPALSTINIADGAKLYSQGSIGFAAGGSVTIAEGAVFGTANVAFGAADINIGSPVAMASANVPAGFNLSQDVLNRLLAGDTSVGAPALQTLTLTASQSLNVFGSIDLDIINPATGKADLNLVLNTPAIYGYGSASDTATLTVGTLTWGGVTGATPGPIVTNGPGTGSGTFNIVANQIVFGFPGNVAPDTQTTFNRVTYGFSTVNLIAPEITSNNKNTLSVYQAQGTDPSGPGTGGALNLETSLLTGAAGSVMGFTAGGALTIAPPSGAAPAASGTGALGAEIDLTGGSINVASTILLPTGMLTMTANGDINLQAGSNLDLAGQATTLVDQTE
jgi:filamentous hemagglutinin family protein